ncbi:Uncharacterised protein [Mycobacteroides abscessus subsp. abscessus]|nr:Uncharacterised protein [Mycobacteroides abscessus subsp. abscessus]
MPVRRTPSTELIPRNHWAAWVFQVLSSMSSSTLKKIGAVAGPPAALCNRSAVCASATPPS